MFIISVFIILIILIGPILTKNYDKSTIIKLEEDKTVLKVLYPFCMFLVDKCKVSLNNTYKKESLASIYIGKNKKQIYRFYLAKKMAYFLGSLFVVSCLYLVVYIGNNFKEGNLVSGKYIYRNNKEDQEIILQAEINNKGITYQRNINYKVTNQKYTREDYKKKLKEAKSHIKEVYLGKNKDEMQVKYPLNLIGCIPHNNIEIQWEFGFDSLVNEDGTLNNVHVSQKGQYSQLRVQFYYENWEDEMLLPIRVLPMDLTKEERLQLRLEEELIKLDQKDVTRNKIQLPSNVNGYAVTYKEKHGNSNEILFVVGVIASILIVFIYENEIKRKIKLRNLEMQLDYPDIVNKFTLLLSAGMNLSRAWGKIAKEYEDKLQKGQKRRYAYDEWITTWYELNSGISEVTALERFGRRSKILNYLKFSSLVSQNLRKGSKGLSELLDYEVLDALEERKALAKRLGEEAGTKLLMPMAIMLILTIAIIMIPAFLSFM